MISRFVKKDSVISFFIERGNIYMNSKVNYYYHSKLNLIY